ncbi:MAG: CRISPR-associated helicase Cas3' [Deferribacteraceae bacterium]|nr:CRISPR-associated helicase Cas3' [Deferribacteraceae bacterium]
MGCSQGCFSAVLLDADRLDSALWEKIPVSPDTPINWEELTYKIDNLFPPSDGINKVRSEISDRCKDMAGGRQGVYTLSVPTGGGKTFASLRFALHHLKEHRLERIVYVIPYPSIIEQNAAEVKEKLGIGGEFVLEDHSALLPENKSYRTKILSQSWGAPIIFTTMYQFLSVLFSGENRYTRKMHNLAKSVIIFDEIQALPPKFTHIFSNAVNFLAEHAGTSVILCMATQPFLNNTGISSQKGRIRSAGEIMEDTDALKLSRVNIYNWNGSKDWSKENIIRLAEDEFKETGKVLIITNTKDWAKRLYIGFDEISNDIPKDALFHLSAYMCADHKSDVIKVMKERLRTSKPVLCVSTQLIEAGVDIDFDVVIRFLAGLASIAQAAGRCNREMRPGITGKVYIIDPEENIEALPEIWEGRRAAEAVICEHADNILSPEAMGKYFNNYFSNIKKALSYNIGEKEVSGRTLLQLLGINQITVNCPADKLCLKQSFKSAGEKFTVFDKLTRPVIVPYGKNGKRIIEYLSSTDPDTDPKSFYALLSQAGRYSVEIFEDEFNRLNDLNAAEEIKRYSALLLKAGILL